MVSKRPSPTETIVNATTISTNDTTNTSRMTQIATSKSVTAREKPSEDGGSNTEGIEKGKGRVTVAAGGGDGGKRSQHFRAMRHPR